MPNKIKTYDFGLLVVPIILLVIGVSVIYSLVLGTALEYYTMKQAFFGVIGLLIFGFASFVDYRLYRGMNWLFYLLGIVLLILVAIFGKTVNGAANWLDLKFFQLQPSEVVKIVMIVVLGSFFSERVGKLRWKDIAISLVLFLPPLVLVLKEPDFGSALVLAFIYSVLLLAARPSKKQLIVILASFLILVGVFVGAYLKIGPLSGILKDYQRQRVVVFLDPEHDPYGRGYNVKQAQIAIGSGGILGRGLGRGTQSQLQFLPEPHTDFIFAGIAESFGFVGALVVLLLYGFLMLKLYDCAHLAQDNFGTLVVMGAAAMFFVQIVINIGMNLGLMPVTGITLPLLSYGGTSVFVSFFALGMVESVFIRHKKISF